jgi:geranylgeranyl pyrophosphate synthase
MEYHFFQKKKLIDNEIVKLQFSTSHLTLQSACIDAIISGKRLRSIIVLELGGDINGALALELIHCASLVIDDCPFFDNDCHRRGNLTIHVKYGTRMAIMVAIALHYKAIELLLKCKNANLVTKHVSKKLGDDISSGQLIDSMPDLNRKELGHALKKTTVLFELAFIIGIYTGNNFERNVVVTDCDIIKYSHAGYLLGVCFQLADDIGDYAVDKRNNRSTFATEISRSHADKLYSHYLKLFRNEINNMNLFSQSVTNHIVSCMENMKKTQIKSVFKMPRFIQNKKVYIHIK